MAAPVNPITAKAAATVNNLVNGHTTNGNKTNPKIHLYTNHACPYAHRAHITLAELNLPYTETIIDLTKPREPWYLEINPRGLVPSIKYSDGDRDEEIITESAVVAQFLADATPGDHLLPVMKGKGEAESSPAATALARARVSFFLDTWSTKVVPLMAAIYQAAPSSDDKDAATQKLFAAIEKELEPLLATAAPFFGGAADFTLAEINLAPFLLRLYAASKDGELVPSWLVQKLDALAHFGPWARRTMERPSVGLVWDGDEVYVSMFKERVAKMRAEAEAKKAAS